MNKIYNKYNPFVFIIIIDCLIMMIISKMKEKKNANKLLHT